MPRLQRQPLPIARIQEQQKIKGLVAKVEAKTGLPILPNAIVVPHSAAKSGASQKSPRHIGQARAPEDQPGRVVVKLPLDLLGESAFHQRGRVPGRGAARIQPAHSVFHPASSGPGAGRTGCPDEMKGRTLYCLLYLVREVFAKFQNFGCHHGATVRLIRIAIKVLLVIILGQVEH